jgi:hypothetical protein
MFASVLMLADLPLPLSWHAPQLQDMQTALCRPGQVADSDYHWHVQDSAARHPHSHPCPSIASDNDKVLSDVERCTSEVELPADMRPEKRGNLPAKRYKNKILLPFKRLWRKIRGKAVCSDVRS